MTTAHQCLPTACSRKSVAVCIMTGVQSAASSSDVGLHDLQCYCRYPDFVLTESGLQYKDLRDGTGEAAKDGSQVTIDWDGYTLGYYGRPFEARNKVSDKISRPCVDCLASQCLAMVCITYLQWPEHSTRCLLLQTKGGAFVGDQKDYFKFKVGERKVRLSLARSRSLHTIRTSKARCRQLSHAETVFADAVAWVCQSNCMGPRMHVCKSIQVMHCSKVWHHLHARLVLANPK